MADRDPRITDEGFQAMKGSQSAMAPPSGAYSEIKQPAMASKKAEIEAILARLSAKREWPTTITLGDEDWAADYYDAEEESVDDLSAFLAGEPIGTAYDPFSETDPALHEQSIQDQLAFQRNEEANRIVEAESRPGSGHQMLKNWLHTLLPSDTTLSVEDMIVPVRVGGEADVKAALRINIFPRVGQEDHEHSYYEEAMLYQEDQARETLRTPKPAMDLGGTEGVDFATRLRESFLNR